MFTVLMWRPPRNDSRCLCSTWEASHLSAAYRWIQGITSGEDPIATSDRLAKERKTRISPIALVSAVKFYKGVKYHRAAIFSGNSTIGTIMFKFPIVISQKEAKERIICNKNNQQGDLIGQRPL